MTKRTMVILVGAFVLVSAAAGALIWAPWDRPDPRVPEPSKQTPQQITEYMASEEFGQLPLDERQKYFERTRELRRERREQGATRPVQAELTDQQRERLHENVGAIFQKMMEERVEKYFSTPKSERVAYLDQMIDRMQEHRRRRSAEGGGRGASSGGGGASAGGGDGGKEGAGRGGRGRPGGPHRGFTPERLKNRIEKTPPAKRAQFVEFHKAMLERMEERGISMGGRGR